MSHPTSPLTATDQTGHVEPGGGVDRAGFADQVGLAATDVVAAASASASASAVGDIAVVLGSRPEAVKLAAVLRGLGRRARIVWTGPGPGDDADPAGELLARFGLDDPHVRVDGVGGPHRGARIGGMISTMTELFEADPPRAVIVHGDTDSTSAGAQAAHYCGAKVLHAEAGLRSGDRSTPAEINRRVVTILSDLHCAATAQHAENLLAEGVEAGRIMVTGTTVVEAVEESRPSAERAAGLLRSLGGVPDGPFVLATLHRPENTGDARRLGAILHELGKLPVPVLLPLHPRTRGRIDGSALATAPNIRVLAPVDHPGFLTLAQRAELIVSDSGGVQEEVTVLKKPLVVVRDSTERPEAVDAGFATLVRPGPEIGRACRRLLADRALPTRLAMQPSPYGDGSASTRIVAAALALADGWDPVRDGVAGLAEATALAGAIAGAVPATG